MAYQSFEELEVWKLGCRLAVDVYGALLGSRDFALADQMRRSVVSVPSNVAEGAELGGKSFLHLLRVARGSSAEFRTQCYIAAEVGVLPRDQARLFVARSKQLSKMLTALAHSVQNKIRRQRKPKRET